MSGKRVALVIGGSGALGRSLVAAFQGSSPTMATISIDFRPNPEATHNIPLLPRNSAAGTETKDIVSQLGTLLKDGAQLAAVVNAAGGWTGGSLKDPGFLSQVDSMLQSSVQSAALASHIAALHLAEYVL
jgi:hypothetical protein